MEDDPLWKKTSKINSRNISSTIGPILLKYEVAENSRLTASAWGWAQLIPACLNI